MSTTSRQTLSWALPALLLWAGCGGDAPPPATDTSANSEALADPFPSSPPDGAVAEATIRAGNYVPTAANSPSTDIWLAGLVRDGGAWLLEDLRNVTDRDGYDNQPSFSPAGDGLYYASALDATQTDVFRYDVASGRIEQVTTTAASEFSPLFIPGQDAFSVTHEAQGLQHLWRHRVDGSEVGPVFGAVQPVAYHAWADEEWVAMVILSDPWTLQLANAVTGEVRVVAEDPGRSLHRIPGTDDLSYVHKIADDEWSIEHLDPATGESERLTLTLPGREDYAWTPDGGILMGDGEVLHAWGADSGWTEVADLSGEGRGSISRIAVSPDGSLVAIVMERGG